MSDSSTSVNDNPELLSDFRRKAGKITGELLCDDLVRRDSAAINLLDQIEKALLQAGRMSVKCCYLANLS
jgi:hypothetical protein